MENRSLGIESEPSYEIAQVCNALHRPLSDTINEDSPPIRFHDVHLIPTAARIYARCSRVAINRRFVSANFASP